MYKGEVTSNDYDAQLFEYFEIFIQYSSLVLFGVLFPPAFMFAYITNYIDIKTKTLFLFETSMRPDPTGSGQIGWWD